MDNVVPSKSFDSLLAEGRAVAMTDDNRVLVGKSVLERVIECIQKIMEYTPRVVITKDSCLHNDLGMDAVDFADVLSEVEDVFEFSIPESISNLSSYTVGQLADYVQANAPEFKDPVAFSPPRGPAEPKLAVFDNTVVQSENQGTLVVAVTVNVPLARHNALEDLSKHTGKPIEQLINDAIKSHLFGAMYGSGNGTVNDTVGVAQC